MERQRLEMAAGKKALDDEYKLLAADFAAGGDNILLVKDLGPQIGWKTVFMTEYARCFFLPVRLGNSANERGYRQGRWSSIHWRTICLKSSMDVRLSIAPCKSGPLSRKHYSSPSNLWS